MKKQIFAIALIVTSLVSCTKDDVNPTNPKAVETSNVSFSVSADKTASATAKQIDRGSIPLYVDNLTINATSSALSPFVATENFTFVGGVTATAPALTLNNVALGTNVFTATSTSADANKVLGFKKNTNNVDLDVLKTKTPYIPCYSVNNPTAVITKTNNAPINLEMGTKHGRVIAKFQQEMPDADNYYIYINAYINGEQVTTNQLQGNNDLTMFADIKINQENNVKYASFEWSNELCIEGAKVKFFISIYEKNAPATPNPALYTFSKEIVVQGGKTTLATYTVHNTDVHTDIQQNGILLQFPTIGEVIIND